MSMGCASLGNGQPLARRAVQPPISAAAVCTCSRSPATARIPGIVKGACHLPTESKKLLPEELTKMADTHDNPAIGMMSGLTKPKRSQEYYEEIKRKFAEERDLRLNYRPEGTAQYTSDLTGSLARYEIDPFGSAVAPREPINDTVEVLFIGGGFSALL